MKKPAVITAGLLLLAGSAALPAEEKSADQDLAIAGVTFDWTVIADTFYVEVKNGSTHSFTLDEVFIEGYNITVIGLDSEFRKIHETAGGVDLERGKLTRIQIGPGNFHRTAFRTEHFLKTLPETVKYIKLRWILNEMGTKLPKGGLESSIYELRKAPNKPDAGDGR